MKTWFVILNGIFAALFFASAVLQLNDPDPWRWAAMYLAASLACLLTWRDPRGRWVAAVVGLVAFAWALVLSPILPSLRFDDLARTMKAENPRIELSRELLGLVIVFAWMLLLFLVRRAGNRDRGTA